jgi:hypothetical protein
VALTERPPLDDPEEGLLREVLGLVDIAYDEGEASHQPRPMLRKNFG